WGTLNVHLLGTWVDYFDISGSDVSGTATEAVTGLECQASATATYAVGDWRLSWRWSYIDTVTQFGALGPRIIPSTMYTDIGAEWNLSDHVQLYAGVNNLFDKQPPLFENGNSN